MSIARLLPPHSLVKKFKATPQLGRFSLPTLPVLNIANGRKFTDHGLNDSTVADGVHRLGGFIGWHGLV